MRDGRRSLFGYTATSSKGIFIPIILGFRKTGYMYPGDTSEFFKGSIRHEQGRIKGFWGPKPALEMGPPPLEIEFFLSISKAQLPE